MGLLIFGEEGEPRGSGGIHSRGSIWSAGSAAAIPAALAMFDYSRDAEREADEDGVSFLRAAGRSALPMVDALCLLQGVEREAALVGLPKLLSTHPKLAERIEHVRDLGAVDPSYRCPDPLPPAGPTCGPDDEEDGE